MFFFNVNTYTIQRGFKAVYDYVAKKETTDWSLQLFLYYPHSALSAFWFSFRIIFMCSAVHKVWVSPELTTHLEMIALYLYELHWLHRCFPCITGGKLYQCVLVFSTDVFTWCFHFPHFSFEISWNYSAVCVFQLPLSSFGLYSDFTCAGCMCML